MALRNETATATATVLLDGKEASFELKQLEQEAKAFKKAMNEAVKAGDKAAFEKSAAGLKTTRNEMGKYKQVVEQVTVDLKRLNGMSFNELKKAQQQITFNLSNMTRGTKEYVAASKQLQMVEAELKKVKVEMYGVQTAGKGISGIANGFNKYFAVATAAVASVTGIVFGIRKSIDAFNEFESKVANLSAITGLAGTDLDYLAQRAKELSTSTTDSGVKITSSADVIVDAFTKMGSARPELLKDKDAMALVTEQALILAEAGKIELDEAIQAVAASMNQFNLDATQSARAINVLAAGSLEGSAEIADLTASLKNVGTVADASNMSLEETVAALEVLAEKQLKGEEAGTMLRGSLIKLKEAGVGYASGNFVLRDALDEVNGRLAGMGSHMEKDQLLIEMFGTRNITVGQVLLANTQKFDDLTAAVTGTNVATRQAITNTDTNAAKLEQARNKMKLVSIELGQKLAPAFTFSTNAISYFIKALKGVIDFVSENKKLITALVIGITTLTAAVKVTAYINELYAKGLKLLTIIQSAYNSVVRATTAANDALNRSMRRNWIGLLLSLLASLISYFAFFREKTYDASKAIGEFNRKLGESRIELDRDFEALKRTTAGTDSRRKAIEEINKKYGAYLPNLLTEKSSLKEIEAAQNAATNALIKNIAVKSKAEEINTVIQESLDKTKDISSELIDEIARKKGSTVAGIAMAAWQEAVNQAQHAYTTGDVHTIATDFWRKFGVGIDAKKYISALFEINEITNKQADDINKLNAFYDNYIMQLSKVINSAGQLKDAAKPDGDTPDAGDEPIGGDDFMSKLNEYKERTQEIYDQIYLQSLEEEERELEVIRMKWDNQLKIAGLSESKIQQLQADIKSKGYENLSEIDREYWDRYIAIIGAKEQELDAKTLQQAQRKELARQEFEQKKRALEQELMKEGMSDEDAEVYAAEQKYKKLIDQAKAFGLDYAGLEDLMEVELDAIREKWDAKRLADEKSLNDKIIAEQQRIFEAKLSVARSTSSAIGAIMQAMGKESQKNAEFYKMLALAQIGIDTGVAVAAGVKAVMSSSTSMSPWEKIAQVIAIAAEIIGAIATATSIVNSSDIPSYAGGLYPMDTTNGRYMVRYGGEPKTGVVSSPTHFVAGEEKPEMIIDGATYRNLQLNAPQIIDAIYQHRIPAHAAGSYPVQTGHALSQTDKLILAALLDIKDGLQQKPAVEVRAKVVYQDIGDMEEAVTRNRSDWNA